MAKTGTASLTIAELREFAGFSESEQRFIERSLDIALARGDALDRTFAKFAADAKAMEGPDGFEAPMSAHIVTATK